MTDRADLIETVARAICAEDGRMNGRKPCGPSRKHACRVCALLATAAVTATDGYRAALLREAAKALEGEK